MANEFATYKEGKYINCKTLFATKLLYNGFGSYFIVKNFSHIMSKPSLRRTAIGFVCSTFVFDFVILREFMKDRDRTDCLYV